MDVSHDRRLTVAASVLTVCSVLSFMNFTFRENSLLTTRNGVNSSSSSSFLRRTHFSGSTGLIFSGEADSASGHFCYVTTVFNNYEAMRAPPILPSDWLTFYITDNSTAAADAIQIGWNSSVSLDPNYYRSPNFRFRLTMIANARIWPERLTDLSVCDHLAFGDGNVAGVDSIYLDWVKASAASGAALSLLKGWYFGN